MGANISSPSSEVAFISEQAAMPTPIHLQITHLFEFDGNYAIGEFDGFRPVCDARVLSAEASPRPRVYRRHERISTESNLSVGNTCPHRPHHHAAFPPDTLQQRSHWSSVSASIQLVNFCVSATRPSHVHRRLNVIYRP